MRQQHNEKKQTNMQMKNNCHPWNFDHGMDVTRKVYKYGEQKNT